MVAVGMQGKRVIVTGASSGIGLVTARELARMGAKVYAIARDRGRGEAALAEIAGAAAGEPPELLLCDFASQRQIRDVAKRYLEREQRLDVLVNNAGAIIGQRTLSEDELELTFATNHIGYFLLTSLLLDALKKSAPSRIVNVASEGHRLGKVDFADLQSERGYDPIRVYSTSKLQNILFTVELAKRLEGTGVTANSLHPGVVATNFGMRGGMLMEFAVKAFRVFFASQEKGAQTSIYLASSPDVEGVTGKYFKNRKQRTPSKAALDEAAALRLWEESERIVAQSA